MRKLIVLLLLAFPAAAQTFASFDAFPSVAVKGVTQKIRLRADDAFSCANPPVWCGVSSVTIAGVQAAVRTTNLTAEIEVDLPDLPVGTVADIVVADLSGNLRRRNAALRIVSASAPYSPDAFDRVLIPVIYDGPGQNGTMWSTDVWVMNGANYDIAFMRGPVPQLEREQLTRIDAAAPNGYVLYPLENTLDDLAINVLVRDLSRQSEALGTELPAVREREFRSRRILLMNVPSDPKYRLTLRVYAFDRLQLVDWLNYWLFDLETGEQVAFDTLTLNPPADETTPWHATIDLTAKHPNVVNHGRPMRLNVSPVRENPASRFWAFLTVTNNETQHVTAITPQP
jgi:hypothetical protein